ncbi:MAG: lipopolysaccharide heptosyltransferase II [Candidatus Omnitrophica bacterium]|nr:lipopolysaccharide heptosyltransferase II [Candidatus Omnitrophota bacterium]
MNILQVLPELNVGGVETGTIDLAKYLVRSGHKAVVVSGGGALVKDLEAVGAVHYCLPVEKKSVFSMLKLIPGLAEIIKKEEIDIVHARSRMPAWIAYFASRRTKTVFITTCHGYYSKHIFSFPMAWGKRVIALSNVIARHMIDDFGLTHERVRIIPRSVDLEKFKFSDPKAKRKTIFNVGIVGRITPLKGHLYFIKAMAKLAKNCPNLKIWIVGDAPQSKETHKEELQVLVKRLGLWNNTVFLGYQKDIPEILSQLDVLVLATTTHEAFGRVIIEAQAAGVPVVATKVGGVIDIIEDQKNGLLVPPADPSSMADAVEKIYKDPVFAARLAENAYKKVQEKYTVDLMLKNTLEVYQDALSNFKILIIKFSSLGDIILSTAALKAIRKKFPRSNYKISFMVSEESKEVLLRCPYIDELLVVDFKNKDRGWRGLMNLSSILRPKGFDISIDLQNNRRSHLLAFFSGILQRYGYDNKKLSFLLNNKIKDEKLAIDPVAHQFKLLNLLGIELKNEELELWPSQEDEEYINDFLSAQWLAQQQKLVGINISASQRWQTKNWPLAQLEMFCEELGRKDIRVVVTGTEKDASFAENLISSVKNAKIINACGKTTVNQLACLIRRCNVFVTPDSSPLHIACAVKVPVVALFGPTDYRRHMPVSKNCIAVTRQLDCSPCYKPKCKTRKCMETITVDEVLEAVDKLLNKA